MMIMMLMCNVAAAMLMTVRKIYLDRMAKLAEIGQNSFGTELSEFSAISMLSS